MLFFHRNASIEPHLLQIDIIFQPVQFLFQRDLLTLGAQIVPEQVAQMHDHLVGGGSVLQPGHAGDHVQSIEQEMRVHLTLEHFQPGVFQIFFNARFRTSSRCRACWVLSCWAMACFIWLKVPVSRPTSSLLFIGRSDRKDPLGNAAGSLRQLQQRAHHRAAQPPHQQHHQCCRRQEQPQIQPRQMPDVGRRAAVKGIFLFQCGLRQPQCILGKIILQGHHMVHPFDVGIR